MTDQKPLTEQQLDDIGARAEVATDGPWVLTDDLEGDGYPGHLWVVRTPASGPDEPDDHSAVVSIGDRALGEFIAHAPQDIAPLLAEVRRLRTELVEQRGEVDKLVRWHREDGAEMDKQRATIERLRTEKRQLGELAARRESELITLRASVEQIRHLHKDSPMGPCPVCIDADAAAAGGDGLVPYPCPTGRLAGAQDCDPPHMRAAATAEGAQR
jgi:hypothetical protein